MVDPTASGQFLDNLILFGRLLRGLGLDVSPSRMLDTIRALERIDIGRKSDVYHAIRCLLVHDAKDIALFDEAFKAFWRTQPGGSIGLDLEILNKQRRKKTMVQAPALNKEALAQPGPEEQGPSDQPPILEAALTYSPREVLRQKDFADLTGEELEDVRAFMAQLLWQLGSYPSRRKSPGRGPLTDFRRTFRQNLRTGSEIMTWAHRRTKQKPRPLVILADVSGSMERYTRLLLHFIYALGRGLHHPIESFVFSTRLTRVTPDLQRQALPQTLDDISRHVPDWSGGTRIGEVLKTFNYEWGRRVLRRGAVVLIISDGWDRGDIDLLSTEMARLQRSCRRLIWLNPLLGSPEYEPLTLGMAAALPFVDDFMPVHNLASLEDLAAHLKRLEQKRRGRAQRRSVNPASAAAP